MLAPDRSIVNISPPLVNKPPLIRLPPTVLPEQKRKGRERTNMKLFRTPVILLPFLLGTPCDGADYYIDSVDGSDSNDGLSILTPWKSHVKAESVSLAAGDVVHFKKGSAFSGNIRISESGTCLLYTSPSPRD